MYNEIKYDTVRCFFSSDYHRIMHTNVKEFDHYLVIASSEKVLLFVSFNHEI